MASKKEKAPEAPKPEKPVSWVEPSSEHVARWAEIARRLLRPDAPRLEQARAVLDELASGPFDPALAWETLASRDVVPSGWAEPGKRTLDPDAFLVRKKPCASMVLALAGDPAGVQTAEELAREAHRRALPWIEEEDNGPVVAGAPVAVEWRTVPRAYEAELYLTNPLSTVAFNLVEDLLQIEDYGPNEDRLVTRRVETATRPFTGRSAAKRGQDVNTPVAANEPPWRAKVWSTQGAGQHVLYQMADGYRFELASRRDACARQYRVPKELEGKSYREIENPYEPALGVAALGYLVAAMSRSRVYLWAPEP